MAIGLAVGRRVVREFRRSLEPLASVIFATAFAAPIVAVATEPSLSDADQRSNFVSTTANFSVRSYCDGPGAAEFAASCESLRQQIQKKWLDKAATEPWRPRCEIVLHATKSSYTRVVGNGAGQTSGSSLIRHEMNCVVLRRIDLVVDQRGTTTALPHELTHVVLADEFGGQQPPPWLDEGIATLADTDAKQARHQRDCQAAIRSGTAFHLNELLTLDKISSDRFPAFYGQSVSLVKFLSELDVPAKLLPFSRIAGEKGYDEALKTTYNINGVGHLHRLWLERLVAKRRMPDIPVAVARLDR